MARQTLLGLMLAASFCVASTTQLRAQVPYQQRRGYSNPYSRPAVSPYLNLFRDGGSVSQNYFNLVRPQQEFRQGYQQNRDTIGQNRQSITELRRQTQALQEQSPEMYLQRQAAGSTLQSTGHSTSFRYPGRARGGR